MKFFVVLVVIGGLFTSFAIGVNSSTNANNTTLLARAKRHLDFLKSSRVYFRANIKSTIFTWGSIWAHAIGFKANMNILNQNKRIRPYRRDTYEVLQQLLNLHGFDGKACVLKAFCTANSTSDKHMANGMLFKLLRHIFKLDEHDRQHFGYLKEDNCEEYIYQYCPLSFNNISPFTDGI